MSFYCKNCNGRVVDTAYGFHCPNCRSGGTHSHGTWINPPPAPRYINSPPTFDFGQKRSGEEGGK